MKIAILGTRGIPNQYGGFEQFAEYLSIGLVKLGHHVTVYNPHFHGYSSSQFNGVNIVKIFSPEKQLGAAANFIYDYLCLRDALKKDFDIIYEAGYQSVAISYMLLPIKKATIVTNMDGLEWKRSKWNSFVKKLTLKFEAIAVKKSDHLVSDNEGIRQYFLKKYKAQSHLIEYGANPVDDFDPDQTLGEFNLVEGEFFLIIARLEPENNIVMILNGYLESNNDFPIIVVGNIATPYGKYLQNTYTENIKIKFIGAVYDKNKLDNLRNTCFYYFHGHSVGGTNPSLLEAMATKSMIVAHDNPFNRDVLEENAFYFRNAEDVSNFIIKREDKKHLRVGLLNNNLAKINKYYTWDNIIEKHIILFNKIIG